MVLREKDGYRRLSSQLASLRKRLSSSKAIAIDPWAKHARCRNGRGGSGYRISGPHSLRASIGMLTIAASAWQRNSKSGHVCSNHPYLACIGPSQRCVARGRYRFSGDPKQDDECNSGRNTQPELTVRSAIRELGVGYRLHVKALPGCPDIVMKGRRKIIEVRGCFLASPFGVPVCLHTQEPDGVLGSQVRGKRCAGPAER